MHQATTALAPRPLTAVVLLLAAALGFVAVVEGKCHGKSTRKYQRLLGFVILCAAAVAAGFEL